MSMGVACRWFQMTHREATTLVVAEPAVAACRQGTAGRRGTAGALEGSALQGCNCERAARYRAAQNPFLWLQ